MVIYDRDYEKLKEIDWSFANCRQDAISLLHPYPARFIEELPRQLIAALGCKDGTIVFDPFCGSGTTLVEAQRLGVESIGVDLNPIACLISRVKTKKLSDGFLEQAKLVAEKAEAQYLGNYISIPEIPNLDHWFRTDVQKALSAMMSGISAAQVPEDTKFAMLFALSSIIVRVSNQESDTRYAAVQKRVIAQDVFKTFYTACKKLAIAKLETSFDTPAEVIESNILDVSPDRIGKKVGLVITSPPYPNAYEYWLYHKYRMWWLGYDPISVRTYEIGARPHYQKKNGQTELDFEKQMSQVFSLFDKTLIEGGHICIVIGRSIIKGREIDNAEMMTKIAKEHGYTPIAKIPRKIASSRKSFNLSYGKITTEHIMIYRRG
ncbi:MAG: RNA methyltransferase [Oscillospiraceae bacterium]|nr:RNA methyltransferase [Oscillospiraceae bacterium]